MQHAYSKHIGNKTMLASTLDGAKVQRSDEGVDFVKIYSVPTGFISSRNCALLAM